MDLLASNVAPAEGESTVRTYRCTYYKSKLLGIQTDGYLGVTNKRLIFLASGNSTTGRTILQSEVPIADVSGINSFKGTYFSILLLVGALILASIVLTLIPALLTAIAYALESSTFFQILAWLIIIASFAGSFLVPAKQIWRTVLAACTVGGLLSLAGLGLQYLLLALSSGRMGSKIWLILLALAALIYLLLCAAWFARRPTFSLEVSSKGGSSTPIRIASAGGFLSISSTNSLNAQPAEDAEKMLWELGALITDIQTLGDYGIAKWTLR